MWTSTLVLHPSHCEALSTGTKHRRRGPCHSCGGYRPTPLPPREAAQQCKPGTKHRRRGPRPSCGGYRPAPLPPRGTVKHCQPGTKHRRRGPRPPCGGHRPRSPRTQLLVRCACAIQRDPNAGGGFDDAHQAFYTVGRDYRVPAFLATSERPVEVLYRAVIRS